MLRKGKYVRERRPKIGIFYVPRRHPRKVSYEEQFMQDVLLGQLPYTGSFWKRLVAKVLAV
jgi:hypothetical protein